MSFIVFLYASGWAFFVGAAMIIASAFVPPNGVRRSVILSLVGLVVFAAPSSIPLNWRMWVVLLYATLAWLVTKNRKNVYRAVLILLWSLTALGEGLYQRNPRVLDLPSDSIVVAVVGDSLTSGLSETKAVNWPKLLAKRTGFVVHDFAVEGATCRKAMAQADKIPEDVNVVIVAIGGNDLLGATSLEEFQRDYDALLKKVWRDERDRVLIGFELPLPPFHNRWGEVQRRIAFNHGVKLIPKWRLMWILADPKNTVDSIHPSQAGQDALADMVESVLKP